MLLSALAMAIYSGTLIMLGYQAGDKRGYGRGLDHAAQLIFGIPVVWP